MNSFEKLLHKSVKLYDDTSAHLDFNFLRPTRNPFAPWKVMKHFWSNDGKNCHSFVSSVVEGLTETCDPLEMLLQLQRIKQRPGESYQRIHSHIAAFSKDGSFTHTGIVVYAEDRWLLVSRYGNQNGIYVTEFDSAKEHYGTPTYYSGGIDTLMWCHDLRNIIEKHKIGKRLNRLSKSMNVTLSRFFMLSSYLYDAPAGILPS